MVEHTDASEVAREDRLITEEPLEIRVRVREPGAPPRVGDHAHARARLRARRRLARQRGARDAVVDQPGRLLHRRRPRPRAGVQRRDGERHRPTALPHRHESASSRLVRLRGVRQGQRGRGARDQHGATVGRSAPRRVRRTTAAGGAARAPDPLRPDGRRARGGAGRRARHALRGARGRRASQRRRQGRRGAGARRGPGCLGVPGAERAGRLRARAEGRGRRHRVDRGGRRADQPGRPAWPPRPASTCGASRPQGARVRY